MKPSLTSPESHHKISINGQILSLQLDMWLLKGFQLHADVNADLITRGCAPVRLISSSFTFTIYLWDGPLQTEIYRCHWIIYTLKYQQYSLRCRGIDNVIHLHNQILIHEYMWKYIMYLVIWRFSCNNVTTNPANLVKTLEWMWMEWNECTLVNYKY